jgi:2-oxoglutarate dehydrogenase E1 component
LAEAASKLSDLTEGSFQPVIDDPIAAEARSAVTRLVFCTGKIYYDLLAKRNPNVALVRVEELYPWPHEAVARIVDLYPEQKKLCGRRKSQRTWARGRTCRLVSEYQRAT